MSKGLGVCWLALELFAVAVLAWAEFGLGTWSSATHEAIAASPDAIFQIRALSWTSAVALGCLMGLGASAAMLAAFSPGSRPNENARSQWSAAPWILVGIPIIAAVAEVSWRHFPWLT